MILASIIFTPCHRDDSGVKRSVTAIHEFLFKRIAHKYNGYLIFNWFGVREFCTFRCHTVIIAVESFVLYFFKFLVTRNCYILFSLLSAVPKPHSSSLKSSVSSLYFKWIIMIFSPFQDNLLYAVWLMMVRYIFVTSHLNTFNVIFLSGHCSCSRFCAVMPTKWRFSHIKAIEF